MVSNFVWHPNLTSVSAQCAQKKEENMRGMNIKNSQYVKKLHEQSQSQGPLIVCALPKGQVSLV